MKKLIPLIVGLGCAALAVVLVVSGAVGGEHVPQWAEGCHSCECTAEIREEGGECWCEGDDIRWMRVNNDVTEYVSNSEDVSVVRMYFLLDPEIEFISEIVTEYSGGRPTRRLYDGENPSSSSAIRPDGEVDVVCRVEWGGPQMGYQELCQ